MTARPKAISGTHALWKSSAQRSDALVPCASRAAFPSREFLSAVTLLFLDSVQQGGSANLAFEPARLRFKSYLLHKGNCKEIRSGSNSRLSSWPLMQQLQRACARCSSWSIFRLFIHLLKSYSITSYSSVSHTAVCFPPYIGFHLFLRSLQLCWEIHGYGSTQQPRYHLLFPFTHRQTHTHTHSRTTDKLTVAEHLTEKVKYNQVNP